MTHVGNRHSSSLRSRPLSNSPSFSLSPGRQAGSSSPLTCTSCWAGSRSSPSNGGSCACTTHCASRRSSSSCWPSALPPRLYRGLALSQPARLQGEPWFGLPCGFFSPPPSHWPYPSRTAGIGIWRPCTPSSALPYCNGSWCIVSVGSTGRRLTIRPSRRHFVARLNSGVRRHEKRRCSNNESDHSGIGGERPLPLAIGAWLHSLEVSEVFGSARSVALHLAQRLFH